MKRSNSKELNILTLVIVLALAFLCIFNITYSYFTASAIINGDTDFGNIKVNFYYTTASSNGVATDGENTLVVSPVGTVSRGTPFAMQYGGEELTSVGFKADTDSCSVYIRFWIDAYIVDNNVVDTSTNYGQYFSFYNGNVACTSSNSLKRLMADDGSNYTYFCPSAVATGATYTPFNRMMLDTNAPADLLGNTIRITIRFEAIQSTNGACKTWEMYKTDENGNMIEDENGLIVINDNKGIINDIDGIADSLKWDTGVNNG